MFVQMKRSLIFNMCENSPWSVGVMRVCGQVDINAATRSYNGSVSSLLCSILFLQDGLREVLINKVLEGFACFKQSKLVLEPEDTAIKGLSSQNQRYANH